MVIKENGTNKTIIRVGFIKKSRVCEIKNKDLRTKPRKFVENTDELYKQEKDRKTYIILTKLQEQMIRIVDTLKTQPRPIKKF